MMPRLPSRSALLVPVLGLGLLVPGINANLTRADTLPAPCELAVATRAADDTAETALLLHAILPVDPETALAVAPPPPIPLLAAPPPPGAPVPADRPGARKPLGTDLRPPDPALVNAEPIMAARQLRESLTEKQKVDLRAVLTKHEDALRQARGRLPQVVADPVGNRPARAEREAAPNQASTAAQRIYDQIDQDIELTLTPAQRALLQKARPKRLRAEQPEPLEVVVAERVPGC